MAFKDILVHVDDGKSCPARLELAVGLAAAHGAHLTGLHVRRPSQLPDFIMAEYGGEIATLQAKYIAEAAATAKSLFDQAVKGVEANVEWRDVTGELLDLVPLHARYADLAIIGQADLNGDDVPARRLVDHLVLDAGRPVLVVPCVGRYPTLGQKVLVAWNAGREATRAIGDAMPILETAARVSVLAINPLGGLGGHGELPGADIALHLARHGVKAVCQAVRADDLEVGALLLSRAADEDADLLVMGAYGRSRLRELVLGGATRHVLDHMTVPVLLSH